MSRRDARTYQSGTTRQKSAEAGNSESQSSGWTSPHKKTLGCSLGSRVTPELPSGCVREAGHQAREGRPVESGLTSARRDRACTLYTDGADADTIAAAVVVASADRKTCLYEGLGHHSGSESIAWTCDESLLSH